MANGMNCNGRKEIFCDYDEITKNNIIEVLQDTFFEHLTNVGDMQTLIDFEAGEQPLGREKLYLKNIDAHVVDNLAAFIVDFKLGFHWGDPINLVQKGKDDTSQEKADAISKLNENYDAAGNDRENQKLARFVEITGVGYTYIDINTDYDEEDGDSYFTRTVLDPRTTYLVRTTTRQDHRVILGVSYRFDTKGNKYFTCFTKDQRFEISAIRKPNFSKHTADDKDKYDWQERQRNGESNPLGRIPIIEWIRSYDRMGCFEKQLDSLKDLNVLASDYTNSVEQNTNAIWWTNDVDLTRKVENEDGSITTKEENPESGMWVHTNTTPEGRTPIIRALTSDYHYNEMLNNYLAKRALILKNAHVPDRNDNSGGSTGIAMDDAAGWSDAEVVASSQERIMEGCKMAEVKVVLSAIRKSFNVKPEDEILLRLRACDVEPNKRRPKSIEITSKSNAAVTLISHGFSLEDTLDIVSLAPDPSQVIERSGEGIRKYQETLYSKANEGEGGEGETAPNSDRIAQDESDQIENSPALQNMS